jgi:hypothetical protein
MKTHWLTNLFLYILGLTFNIALIVVVLNLVSDYSQKGYAFGEEMANELTKKMPDR